MVSFKRWHIADKGDITRDSDPKDVLGIGPEDYKRNDYNASEMEVI